MIYGRGRQAVEPRVKAAVTAVADDSFTSVVSDSVGVPVVPGWRWSPGTLTALKIAAVDPHVDEWVGNSPEPEGADRRTLFWVVDVQTRLELRVGSQTVRVMFDDRVEHEVRSRHEWTGVAYQVRRTA